MAADTETGRVTSSESDLASCSGVDAWVPAHEENLTRGLYRLPDELILKIMAHLPSASLYLLHQSCRLFTRFFQGPELDDWWKDWWGCRDKERGLPAGFRSAGSLS